MLRTTRTVIVDEIHAVADDKRGSHLALSLARLDALAEDGQAAAHRPFGHGKAHRAGRGVSCARMRASSTSATAARWSSRWKCRATNWAPWRATRCGPRSMTAWPQLILTHRTTLVFVNTRRLSERVAHALAERLGENVVLPHHGSLSRRLAPERRSAAEKRRAARSGGDGFARTGHRHRHRWIWCARSARRDPSPSRCSASAARDTGWAPSPRAASSPPRATS